MTSTKNPPPGHDSRSILFDSLLACALGPVVLTQAPQHCEHDPLQTIGQNLGLEPSAKQATETIFLNNFLQSPHAILTSATLHLHLINKDTKYKCSCLVVNSPEDLGHDRTWGEHLHASAGLQYRASISSSLSQCRMGSSEPCSCQMCTSAGSQTYLDHLRVCDRGCGGLLGGLDHSHRVGASIRDS